MEFEWAPTKAAANLRKHKVSFDEAVTVFADFFSVTAPDPDHSSEELRYITVGRSIVSACLWWPTPNAAVGYGLSVHGS